MGVWLHLIFFFFVKFCLCPFGSNVKKKKKKKKSQVVIGNRFIFLPPLEGIKEGTEDSPDQHLACINESEFYFNCTGVFLAVCVGFLLVCGLLSAQACVAAEPA